MSHTHFRHTLKNYLQKASGLVLLQSKGPGGSITNFGRPPILYRPWIYIASILRPPVTVGLKFLERLAFQVNQSLPDNGFHLTVPTLNIHHHRNRHTTGHPIACRACRMLYNSHIARLAVGNKVSSTCTKSVTIAGIKV